MADYEVPINSVDALVAHFAEWVRFLDAKGRELEAQVEKLEARKANTGAPVPAPLSGAQGSFTDADFLKIAFGGLAEALEPDSSNPANDHEPIESHEIAPPEASKCDEATQPKPTETNASTELDDDPSIEPPGSIKTETPASPPENYLV